MHVKVLKKGVLDEQAKSNELRETLKDKEKSLRKGELEIDSLTFRNQQLTRRVSVLQDELDALQVSYSICKLNRKNRCLFSHLLINNFILILCGKHYLCFAYSFTKHIGPISPLLIKVLLS